MDREYAIYIINFLGDHYILGHYKDLATAKEMLAKKRDTSCEAFIVTREVGEWEEYED